MRLFKDLAQIMGFQIASSDEFLLPEDTCQLLGAAHIEVILFH